MSILTNPLQQETVALKSADVIIVFRPSMITARDIRFGMRAAALRSIVSVQTDDGISREISENLITDAILDYVMREQEPVRDSAI